MSDTDKAIISESYINILQHRIEELEAENRGLLAAAESLAADVYTKESE